jgi:glycosyltransferase involved in cell wall biosynthesis
MNSQIKISVITACLNSRDSIIKTLDSLLNQNYSNIEYIIIDGGSNDGTLEIIESYKKMFLTKNFQYIFKSEKDKGIADAWNKGLKMSSGDIIYFLNADDWIPENTLLNVSKVLNINLPQIAYGLCNRIDENDNFKSSFQNKFNKYRVIWNFGFSFTTCFCTRKVYEKVGEFNLKYKIAIDSDFLLRCINQNVNFIYNDHEVFMRTGGVSLKYRELAHKEYRKALINNGYSKLLVDIAYFFYKFT